MKRKTFIGAAAGGLVLAASTVAGQSQETFKFISAESAIGAIVRGAPYSAEATTRTTQVLGDGTRIERIVRAQIYRDSEGRVRREQTILGLGVLDSSADGQNVITIVDPVAQVQYVLHPATREARRSSFRSFEERAALERKLREAREALSKAEAAKAGDQQRALAKTAEELEARMRRPETRQPGEPAPPPPPPPPPPDGSGLAIARRSGRVENLPNSPQALGTKQVEGVTASGTRRSETIPAGRIGNDRPIVITDERWESAELRVLVLSEHHDPRTGDVEYRLTNINRAEPSRDLFTVPSDYTIVDAPPPPPPPPVEPQ